MNPEQEALAEIVEANSILRLIAHLIAQHPEPDEIDLSRSISKRETGLSTAQYQKAIEWFIRKGFLRQATADAYPRVKARYAVNAGLRERAISWRCMPFGSVGKRMLQATAEKFDLPSSTGGNVVLWTWPDGNVLDHCGRLLPRGEAKEIRLALDRYLTKYEAMSDEAFEKHKESQEGFLWWGNLLNPYDSMVPELRYSGTVSRYLSPPVCGCDQCKDFHQLAFTTLTNYFNYEKQEKKELRVALKAIA